MRDYTRLEIVEMKSLRGCDSLITTGTTRLSYWLRRCVVYAKELFGSLGIKLYIC